MNISKRYLFTVVGAAVCTAAGSVMANPIDPNPTVVSGQVAFEGLQGNHASVLQQSQQAIVDYTHFNIVEGGSVTFVQPNADAAILNRITGADPSMINGSVLANGQVYFVNPAGVTFGPNSVVRADMFMAIAGDMTNADFLNGSMRFDLTGTVDNQGLIETQRGVALVGRQVRNTGEIVAKDGFAILASGDEVLLQPKGTSLAVQVTDDVRGTPEAGVAVENLGTVDGEEIMFSAGDAFATAVRHSGTARAKKSAKVHSDGGRIEVSGGIKAGDSTGGGRIEVGGTDQGGSGAPTAAATTIASSAVIDASATGSGDGGHVVVWSDGMTEMFGSIQATGADGGTGGFAEVSGHYVDFGPGGWNVMLGNGGEFLIDPFDYIIGGTEADAIRDLLSAGTSVTVDTEFDVAAQGSTGAGAGDITLAAPIIVSNDTNQATLTLEADNNIVMNAAFVSAQSNGSGTPVLVLNAANDITVNADITARSSAPASRGPIQLTAGGDILIDANIDAGGGNLLITSTMGNMTLGTDKVLTAGVSPQPSLIEIIAENGTISLGGVIELFADSNVYIKADQFVNTKGSDLVGGVAPGSWTIALPHPVGRDGDSRPVDQHQYGSLASGNTAQYGQDGSEFSSTGGSLPDRNTYYFYDFVPEINITVDPKVKTYGNDVTNLGPYVADVNDLVDSAAFPYGGVFTQDTLSSAISGTAVFTSAGEPSTAAVGSYPINISGLSSPNGYSFKYNPGTLTVNQRAITLTANQQSKIYGDTMVLDSTAFTVLDLDGGPDLPNNESITNVDLSSLNLAETDTTLAAATYGMDISINPDTTTLVGAGGFVPSNYAFTYVPGDLVVVPRDITVVVDPQDKFYGDVKSLSNTEFTVRDKGVVGDSLLPNGDAIASVDVRSKTGKDTSRISDVDTYAADLESTGLGGVTGLDLGNYNITFVDGDFVITPRPVTLTANDQTKIYGDVLPLGTTAFTITDNGLTPPANPFVLPNGETIDAVSLNSINGIDASTTTPVGTTAAEIEITGQTGGNGFKLSNYALSYVNGSLEVLRRPVTLTADKQEKIYGDILVLDDTAFTIADKGVVGNMGLPNNETIDTVTVTSLGGNDASTTSNAGLYVDDLEITDQVGSNGFVLSNYDLTYVKGDLEINPREVVLTAGGQSKTYGDPLTLDNTAFTILDKDGDAELPNLEMIDTVDLLSANGVDASTTADAGLYTDEIEITGQNGSNGFLASNYDLSYVAGDLEVLTRALTLTATQQEKIYGDTLALDDTAFTVLDKDGDAILPNNEMVDTVNLVSQNGVDADTTANAGTYTDNISITGQSGSAGFDAGNYAITYEEGDLVVNQRAVTLTASQQEKIYGDPLTLDDTAFTVLDKDGNADLPNNETIDTVNLLSRNGVDASTTAPVATYTDEIRITDQSGSNGFLASNYVLTYVDGDLVVNRRAVTLTATKQDKTYGDPLTLDDTAFTVTDKDGGAGLPNGESIDTVDLVSATGVDASTTAGARLYDDEILITGQNGSNGFLASNYDLSYVAGDLEVLARALTLTATQQEKIYGDALVLDDTAFTVLDKDGDAMLPNGEMVDTVALVSDGGRAADTTTPAAVYTDNLGITGQSGSNGFDAGNYAITYVDGDLLVNQRAVTLAASQQEKIYGDPLTLDDTAFTLLDKDGDAVLPNGETVDAVNLVSAGGVDASTSADVGTYSDNISIAGQNGSNGFDPANYALSYEEGDLVVNQRALTLTALEQERGYGTSMVLDPTAFSLLDQDGDALLPNGEMVDALTLVSTGGLAGDRATFPDTYPGNIVPVGQTGSAGFKATNYDITYVPGDLRITGFPAGTVLMAEGAFEDYAELFLDRKVEEPFGLSDPTSKSATLSIFGFPEWAKLNMSQRLWVLSMIDQAEDEKITEEYLLYLIAQARNAS